MVQGMTTMTTDNEMASFEPGCRRKDFRRFFESNQPLYANCLTKSGKFKERVQNLSAKGAFLATRRKLSVGDEIAMTIPLVHTKAMIRATGEIIRLEPEGVGVEFRVIFNY
jgi:hypothetical protein